MTDRPYPILLTDEERKSILAEVETLWAELEGNELGGYSGINRPFYILHAVKRAIEKYGYRDVGLTWSKRQLEAEPSLLASQITPAEEAQIAHCQLSWIEEGGETHPQRIASIRAALNRLAKMEEPSPVSHVVPAAYIEPAIFETLKAGGSGMFPISNSAFKGPKLTVPLYAAPPSESEAISALREMVRLADMGFEASLKEPEENGNYAAYERAKRVLAGLVESTPQPRVEPSLPAGFNREEIEEMLSIVEMEPQTVDVGNEWGPHESTDGWYTRLLRAILGKTDG